MNKAFLSYRHEDYSVAFGIADGLKLRRLQVFIDRDLQDGEKFTLQIQNEIEECSVMIVIIGKGWVSRISELRAEHDWVRKEILRALKLHKPIIPILADEVTVSDITTIGLPQVLQELFDYSFKSVTQATHDQVLGELKSSIKHLVTRRQKSREWTTLNGVKGALNLAWRHLDLPRADIEDVDYLTRQLIPELFKEKGATLKRPRQDIRVVEDTLDQPYPIGQTTYKTIEIGSKKRLQVGIRISDSPFTFLIYEQLRNQSSARLLTIVFEQKGLALQFNSFELLEYLNTLPRLYDREFKVPDSSVFVCRVLSDRRFQHSYMPVVNDQSVNSDVLATLFDVGWIGSPEIECTTLDNFHTELLYEYRHVTMVHAVEL